MCKRKCFKFRCGHTKYHWSFCSSNLQANIDNDRPCHAGQADPNNQDARVLQEPKGNCCSVLCCQMDLDQRTKAIQDQEDKWQIPRGGSWKDRKIRKASLVQRAPATESLGESKRKFAVAAEQHFLRCLPRHGGSNGLSFITNEDLLRWGQPLREPRPLQIPERPEIFDKDREKFEAEQAKWQTYAIIKKDQQLFQDWRQRQLRGPGPMPFTLPASARAQTAGEVSGSALSGSGTVARRALTGPPAKGVLPEMRVEILHNVFRDIHQRNQLDAGLLAERVRDLQELANHLNALQPRGPDPRFHPLEYAIHMPMLTSLHFHMYNLRQWLQQQVMARTVNLDLAAHMERVAAHNQERLRVLMQDFNRWLNSQDEDTNRLVGRYQRDSDAFDEARTEYFVARRQAEERWRADRDIPERGLESRQASSSGDSMYGVSSSSSSASRDSFGNLTRISRPAGRGTVRVVSNIQPALWSQGVGAAGIAQGGGISAYDAPVTEEPESLEDVGEGGRRRRREESQSTQRSRGGSRSRAELKRSKRDLEKDRDKRPDRG